MIVFWFRTRVPWFPQECYLTTQERNVTRGSHMKKAMISGTTQELSWIFSIWKTSPSYLYYIIYGIEVSLSLSYRNVVYFVHWQSNLLIINQSQPSSSSSCSSKTLISCNKSSSKKRDRDRNSQEVSCSWRWKISKGRRRIRFLAKEV